MKTQERQSRTAYDEDGRLTAYDFCDATEGTVLQLVTEKGRVTTLVRQKAEDDVMTGWSWGGDDDETALEERVRLSREYAMSGSVVLRPGMGVHIVAEVNVEADSRKPERLEQRLHALGVVAEMGVWIEDEVKNDA
jgi:hypothetical protein